MVTREGDETSDITRSGASQCYGRDRRGCSSRHRMTAHHCNGELVRTIYYAPIGVPGEHTAFVLFRCPCGRAGVFPEANYRATTVEFRQEFESGLAVQGARIELVGAHGAPITTDSAARLQTEAGQHARAGRAGSSWENWTNRGTGAPVSATATRSSGSSRPPVGSMRTGSTSAAACATAAGPAAGR
jgi:hypothetical protein